MPGPGFRGVRGETDQRGGSRWSGRRHAMLPALIVLLLGALLFPAVAFAQEGHGEEAPEQTEPEPLTSELPECLICHGEPYLGAVEVEGQSEELFIDPDAYASSAHALLPCTACHIGFSHDNPHNMVTNAEFFAQTAQEACRNCHDDQYEMFQQSYHGELSRGGVSGGVPAPNCVDCHGNHAVREVDTMAYQQEIGDICGQCHGGREETFMDTYHGKAVTLGREDSATCVDCHGGHFILPESNPESTLSEANILDTCQQCHPDASQGFTTYLVHIDPTSTDAPLIVFLVAVFYLLLIVGVFAFGGIHTLLYIYRGLREGLYFGKGGNH